ncbi:MAG: CHC2 zinc finger domain-containing protein, partial [Gemmatimonadaceae bacterium]|nr:CHC2 zinc finger domain-containing protein [Gemmatimonadaceae bacterium]
MSRIPDYLVDQIRERTDIVSFIGKWVDLKKKGKDHYGPCPFHDDGSPSFSVSKKGHGFFKCFGCGEHGDVIQFLQLKGMSFRDAVAYLGQQCGIDIDANVTPPEDYDPAKRARDRERAEKLQREEQEAGWAEVAKKQAARFRRAEPAALHHPYLQAKGITSAPGLKQEGNDLLIPMRAAETDKALLMSIQTIGPGGFKRFAEGGRVHCTRTVIGAEGFKDR